MFKKLLQKYNAEIKIVHKGTKYMPTLTSGQSYYKQKYCSKCDCTLFPGEIMCPDCLNPVI